MRLISIRGENLASLSAPFEIDLDGPPLGDAGLFMISGPTGAGKSTLLDAICLALYDRLPRLDAADRRAQMGATASGAGAGAQDPRSILTHGSGQGWAEVAFVGQDGRRYRAKWAARRARGASRGRLQSQSVELWDALENHRLSDKKTEALALIRRRIGLSFEQFRRACLLAQGDFDAFLRARGPERAELLERITGGELFSTLSQEAHRRARLEREALAGLSARADAHAPMTTEDRAVAEARAAEREAAKSAAEARAEQVQAARRWSDARAQLNLTAKTRAAEAASALRTAGTAFRRAEAALTDAVQVDARAAEESAQVLEKTAMLAPVAGVRAELLSDLKARSELAAAHETAQNAVADAARAAAAAAEDFNAATETDAAEREAAQNADARAAAAERALAEHDLGALARRTERLARARAALEERRRAENAAAAHAAAAEAARAEAARQRERAETARSAAADSERAETARAEALRSARGALDVWRAAESEAAEALRSALIAGAPCPVCGSEHHAVDAVTARLSGALNRERARVAELESAWRAAATARATARSDAEAAETAATQTEARGLAAAKDEARERAALVAAGEALETAAPELDLPASSDPSALEAALERLKTDIAKSSAAAARAQKTLADAAEHARAARAASDAARTRRDAAQKATVETAAAQAQALRNEAAAVARRHDLDARLDDRLRNWRADWAMMGAAVSSALTEALAVRDRAEAAHAAIAARAPELARLIEDAKARRARWAAPDDVSPGPMAAQEGWRGLWDAALRSEERAIAAEARAADADAARAGHAAPDPSWLAAVDDPALSPEALAAAQARAEDALRAARTAAEEARLLLRQDDAARTAQTEAAAALTAARRSAEPWLQLDELIGAADGGKFRRFAQAWTLRRLVALANRRLATLRPRYALEVAPDSDLALQVVDQDMGDEIRGVHNLSGGERFLISLALALGLAGLATEEGVRIESLFIDEGFGALDAESLGVAVSALEALRASGRRVGVISHTPEMRERIAAQIRVRPVGGGRSVVETTAFGDQDDA